jgi:ankyrin repeat protein
MHVNDDYALKKAGINGHIEIVKYLIEKGSIIHKNNNIGTLVYIKNEYKKIVKYLIENGQV